MVFHTLPSNMTLFFFVLKLTWYALCISDKKKNVVPFKLYIYLTNLVYMYCRGILQSWKGLEEKGSSLFFWQVHLENRLDVQQDTTLDDGNSGQELVQLLVVLDDFYNPKMENWIWEQSSESASSNYNRHRMLLISLQPCVSCKESYVMYED